MSILISQDPVDKKFTVIVSDVRDQPAQLLAAVNKQCPLRSIKALMIISNFNTPAWRHVLRAISPRIVHGMKVQHYEASNGTAVVASTPPTPPTSDGAAIAAPPTGTLGIGGLANAAALQMQLTTVQQAQSINTQIDPNAQEQQMERWKIMQDTQTKIFEITQDVTVSKARIASKALGRGDYISWDDYIHL